MSDVFFSILRGLGFSLQYFSHQPVGCEAGMGKEKEVMYEKPRQTGSRNRELFSC